MRKSLIDWCIENDAEYILKEWDEEKNESLTADMVTSGSNKKGMVEMF